MVLVPWKFRDQVVAGNVFGWDGRLQHNFGIPGGRPGIRNVVVPGGSEKVYVM
jgi:hypothetical protein